MDLSIFTLAGSISSGSHDLFVPSWDVAARRIIPKKHHASCLAISVCIPTLLKGIYRSGVVFHAALAIRSTTILPFDSWQR